MTRLSLIEFETYTPGAARSVKKNYEEIGTLNRPFLVTNELLGENI